MHPLVRPRVLRRRLVTPFVAALAAGTLVLAACSKSTTTSGSSSSPSPAASASASAGAAPVVDSPAANLRVTVNLLLGEHISLAIKAVDAALNGRTQDFSAYNTQLNTNGTDIGALIGQVYGADAQKSFNGIWSAHDADFVEYTQGLAAKDTAKQNDAVSLLTTQYVPQFSALIAGATGLPTATVTSLVGDHIMTTKAVVDDLGKKDYTKAATDLRTAYAHMQMIADPLAEAIAAQHSNTFAGNPKNAGVDFRVALNNLLQEHVYLATAATQDALIGNSAEFMALGTALNNNGTDLGAAIGTIYGASAQSGFNGIWSAHNADFVEYTQGLAAGDTAKENDAVNLLTTQYIPQFASFLAGPTGIPTSTLTSLLGDHIMTTKAVVDAQGADAKSSTAATASAIATADRMAGKHMEMIGDPLAKAIVASQPAKFSGAATGASTAPMASPTPSASGASPQAAGATTVQVVPDANTIGAYSPPTVTVTAGQSVTWVFQGAIPHTVTADDNSFSSGGVSNGFANGQTYTHAFPTAGSYPYHCAIHPQMHGTVIVQ